MKKVTLLFDRNDVVPQQAGSRSLKALLKYTPRGEGDMFSFILEDGTELWLNGNTPGFTGYFAESEPEAQ